MTRFRRWVDRNPWCPLLRGSDGRTGRQRLRADAAYWGALNVRIKRQHRGANHG